MSSSKKICLFLLSSTYSLNKIWIPTFWQKALKIDTLCRPYFSIAESIESLKSKKKKKSFYKLEKNIIPV